MLAPTPIPGPVADALINRELSLLDFNRRVLALAENPDVPLLERLRFLSIVGSNLDEFFEIRVAGLKSALRENIPPPTMTLQDVRAELDRITEAAHGLVADQYRVLNQQVLPQLAQRGIRLLRNDDRSEAERAWVAQFFEREVRPLLTPIGLDPAHPFPQIGNKTLNFIVELSGRDAFGRETTIVIVKAPRVVPRVIRLPAEVSGNDHVVLPALVRDPRAPGRPVSRTRDRRLLAIPADARRRPVDRRGGSEEPPAGACWRAAAPPVRRAVAARGRGRMPGEARASSCFASSS